MAYCHECGEKTAPEDVFCPYCGISLKSSVVPSENISVSENVKSEEKIATPEIFQTEQISSTPEIVKAEENFSPPALPIAMPDETIPEPEVVYKDISLPAPPKDFSVSGQSALPTVENFSDDEEILEIKTPENISEDWEMKPVKPENLSKDFQISDVPPSESKSDFSPNLPEPENVYDATVAYTAEDFAKNNLEISQENSNVEPIIEIESPQISAEIKNTESEISETAEQIINISSPSIKPQNDFAEIPVSTNSIAVEEKTSAPALSVPKIVSEPEIIVENPPSVVGVEEKSHTQQNVNESDTGGKKTKLKPLGEGTKLNGRYKIIRKIGGGGMGAVYLAKDENLGDVERAVKEMVQSYIEEDQQEKAVQDFKRESLLLSQLEHPAIPTIYDYFYDDKEGRFYLVMKYISGGDLASRLRSSPEGRIDEKTVTEWAIQIADVLDYLHTHKPEIVYRDLKPSNIMIDGKKGKVMLIDFGIARSVNKEEKGVTAVGTMGYAPPELFSGNVEPRSDIYSLGSTMFHLLTGADPQNNPLLIFDFNKNPRPRQINPSLSDQIEKILMRAVEYSAERRFGSAAEMRDTLNQHLQNLETHRITFGQGSQNASVGGQIHPVFCGFCGQKIMANDLFCPFCGAKQPPAGNPQVSGASANFVSAPVTAKLLVVNTSDLVTPIYKLEKDTNLIGRRDPMSNIFPEVDLSKYDPQTKISRRHARIWRKDGKFLVEDLGSSNGTMIFSNANETVKLLPQQPRILADGDKLKLGDTTLHFVVG